MAWVFQGRQAVFGLGDLPWRRLAHVSQELGFKATAVEISASQKESLRSHWNMVRHFYGFRTFEQEGGFIINQDIDVMVRSRFQPKRVPVRHQDPGLRKSRGVRLVPVAELILTAIKTRRQVLGAR